MYYAEKLDDEIHKNFRLFPGNYIAADLLRNNTKYSDKYNAWEEEKFNDALAFLINGGLYTVAVPKLDNNAKKQAKQSFGYRPLDNELSCNVDVDGTIYARRLDMILLPVVWIITNLILVFSHVSLVMLPCLLKH